MVVDARAHQAVGRDAEPVELEAGRVEHVAAVGEAHLGGHRARRAGARAPASSITATASGSTVVSLLKTAIHSPCAASMPRDTPPAKPSLRVERDHLDRRGSARARARRSRRAEPLSTTISSVSSSTVAQRPLERLEADPEQVAALVVDDDRRDRDAGLRAALGRRRAAPAPRHDRLVLLEHLRDAASVSAALRSQLNCAARSSPARDEPRADLRRRRWPSSSASASASPSSGSTSRAASPQVSGSAVRSAATTGTPLAIASSTGRPKPSYSDGIVSASAPA